ncbi:helix-turn-helix domain-containing protein [Trinickia symbiotica]|nr:helix-turn-helix domain-containing protein [Trinickia symbiotica]
MRIGLSQDELAAIGGVTRRTQHAYESDNSGRGPDANYLLAAREAGVDVVYVLTGEHVKTQSSDAFPFSEDEREIVRKYRLLNEGGKGAVEAMINGYLVTGTFTESGKAAKRIPRLASNRAAAMDSETLELVRRALDDQRQRGETRAKKRPGKAKA